MRSIKFSGTEIQTDSLIPARRPVLVLINKMERTCHLGDLVILVDYRVEMKENEKIDKYLDFARELKRAVVDEGDTNCIWCLWNGL